MCKISSSSGYGKSSESSLRASKRVGYADLYNRRKIFQVSSSQEVSLYLILTLRRPLRRKLRMRWFFDVSKVKVSSFFLNRTSLTPIRFLMRIFWKIPILALPYGNENEEKITFFIHTNQALITSFYIKRCLFLPN